MTFRPAHRDEPVTADRIERALDGLAGIIADAGDGGRVYLPMFARLERELAEMREGDAALAAVLERAARKRGAPRRP